MSLHVSNMLLSHPILSYGSVLLGLLTFLVVKLLFHMKIKEKQYPPSPPTLPLLGNLHQMSKGGDLVSLVTEMAKAYGPVMTLWTCSSPLVVISGYAAIWEALVNQASNFAGRPPLYSTRMQFTSADFKTIMMSPCNEHWSELRKILHNKVFSPFHIASHASSHGRHVNHLVDELMEQMKANDGVVRPLKAFKLMAVSFIAEFCLGSELGYEKHSLHTKLEELIDDEMLLSREGSPLLDSFPITRYFIPSSWKTDMKWRSLRNRVMELLLPLIRSVRSGHGSLNATASSFLDCLVSAGKLTDEEIALTMYEIFILGVDSTSIIVEWALAYLITHPQVQDRAYQEINEAILPTERTVRMGDLGKLPYVNAVVKETLRREAIAPLAVPHQTINDCKVMGVNIPAKSVVVFNLRGIGHDPQVWREAEGFMPGRFIGADNDLDKDQKVRMSYIPFGAGRRICAGMEMANVHIPVTLANLLRKFEWMPVREGNLPDLTPNAPWGLRCMKYPLEARIRCR